MGDPVAGRGADCILLTLRVLEAAGLARPAAQAWWYRDLRAGVFDRVEAAYRAFTEPAPGPVPWSVTIFQEDGHRGFAVVADGGLVTATPDRGVHWIALTSIPLRTYRTLKP